MSRSKIPPSTKTIDPIQGPRILEAARGLLFTRGVNGTTMDDLAHELGMSKKTLYLHFPGKDAILGAIVDELAEAMQAEVNKVLVNENLSCTERLCGVIESIGARMSRLTPAMLLDLKRNAPVVHDKIDGLRRKNIPRFFGRIIRDGMSDGTIRSDIDPEFATEFWLQAIRGLMDPDTLERTKLNMQQTLHQGVELFFRGLLTPTGRDQFQKHQQKCRRHPQASA